MEADPMLTDYFDAAMKRAIYQKLADGFWFGEIPNFPGLWADELTREEVKKELSSALEDWIVMNIAEGESIPILDGIDLNVRDVA